jgi:hypothetical protein
LSFKPLAESGSLVIFPAPGKIRTRGVGEGFLGKRPKMEGLLDMREEGKGKERERELLLPI